MRIVSNKLKRRCNVGRLPNTKRESVAFDASSRNIRWLPHSYLGESLLDINVVIIFIIHRRLSSLSSSSTTTICKADNYPQLWMKGSMAVRIQKNGKGIAKILLRSWNENINGSMLLLRSGMKLSTHHSFYRDRGIPFITIVEWNYQRTPIFITVIESNYYILFLVRYSAVWWKEIQYNTIRYDTIQYEQSTTPTWCMVNNDAITIRYDTMIWYNNTILYKQHTSFDGLTGWLNNTVINNTNVQYST